MVVNQDNAVRKQELVAEIKNLYEARKKETKWRAIIAADLNESGMLTPTGKEWNSNRLNQFIRTNIPELIADRKKARDDRSDSESGPKVVSRQAGAPKGDFRVVLRKPASAKSGKESTFGAGRAENGEAQGKTEAFTGPDGYGDVDEAFAEALKDVYQALDRVKNELESKMAKLDAELREDVTRSVRAAEMALQAPGATRRGQQTSSRMKSVNGLNADIREMVRDELRTALHASAMNAFEGPAPGIQFWKSMFEAMITLAEEKGSPQSQPAGR